VEAVYRTLKPLSLVKKKQPLRVQLNGSLSRLWNCPFNLCTKLLTKATFLDLPHGSASNDTFRRVFSLLDPQVLGQCFRQWMATTAPPLSRGVVAIGGKTVRRSFDRGRAQGPLHVVSAFATAQDLSLGQVGVLGKGQELAAIPVLINPSCGL